MRLRRLSLIAAGALLAAGCGRGEYETADVSGRVTINGKPAVKVAVMFQPVAPEGNINPGPGSYGITDEDGRYTLKLVGKETSGAVVGKHKVRIAPHDDTPFDPANDGPRKLSKSLAKVPAKYNAVDAILEFDVTADGTDKADFDLK